MKLIDLLKEVGEASSKPYNWKQTADYEDYKEYMFQTKSGFYYKVEIEVLEGDEERDSAFIQFGIVEPDEDDMGFTNFDAVPSKGDLFNIMSTIVEVLKDLVKKNPNIKYLQFETTKGKSKESNARLNLYTKYIQKHLPNSTMSTDSRRGYEMTSIKLKEIGDASAKAYKFEKIYDGEEKRTYGFETDSNQIYKVVLDEIEPDDPFAPSAGVGLDIRFYTVGEDPEAPDFKVVTNKGELYKVMATIVEILKFELKQRPYIKTLKFSPSKRKEDDVARLELYKRFLKNFYPNVEYQTYGDEVIAILKK